MLNNFCFHVYAQKSLFIGQNVNVFFTSLSPPDIRVHIVGSQLKTLENTFKTCGTATTTFCMGVEQSIGKAILHFMAEVRGGKSETIYTSDFFGTHKFTPKVRDSRQIQCYSKCAIRDKSNTKKV